MDRLSGWMRGTGIAALLVLSTGACAQRVTPPPQTVAPPPPPVAQRIAPPAAPAPVPAPRAAPAPAPQAQRQVAAPPPAPAAPRPPAAAPRAITPRVAPQVRPTPPRQPGGQYRVAEVASDDYGSAVAENPTPDAAPDLAALTAGERPPAPAPARTPPEPRGDTLAALSTLFGNEPDTAPALEDAPEPEEEESYDTAQLVQPQYQPFPPQPVQPPQPRYNAQPQFQTQPAQPGFGAAPAPFPAPAFDPNGPVTVAVLTPDSDTRPSIRALAEGLAQAATLSARTLNDPQLTLRGYDTGGTPEKAQLAARQAISDGAQLIIGPLFSGSAAAVASVAQGAGVPVIAFTTDRTVLRRGVYSVGYLPDAEVERMLSFAAERGIGKIGLLSPDTPYGGIVYGTVQNAAPAYGVNVATVQPISPDFAKAAETGQRFAEFYRAAPDTRGVLIATNGKPLQAIAAYLAYNDVLPSKVQYMGLGTWDDPETFREATLRGGWFPGLDPALKADFEGRYRDAYGQAPPAVAALAYDGVAIAGRLIAQARASGQAPFTAQALENPEGFRGMSGLFRLLPDGRNQRLLSILKVGRREFEMLDPAPSTFGQRLSSIGGFAQ